MCHKWCIVECVCWTMYWLFYNLALWHCANSDIEIVSHKYRSGNGGQVRNQINEWSLFLGSDIFSIISLYICTLFIHYVFFSTELTSVILVTLFSNISIKQFQLIKVSCAESYPLANFCVLILQYWNRFTFYLPVHIVCTKWNGTRNLCISYVILFCKYKSKTHAKICVNYVGL
jgi:hypothetical protein